MRSPEHVNIPGLTPEQHLTVDDFLNQFHQCQINNIQYWRYTLKGYAGTGKTFVVAELLRQLAQHGYRKNVLACAPTNKATGVLRQRLNTALDSRTQSQLNLQYGTLHSWLKLTPEKNPDGTVHFTVKEPDTRRIPIHDIDLVILDECSMIGQHLLDLLNTYTRPHTAVLFVGDPAQLPPVEDDSNSQTFDTSYQSILTQIVRQSNDNSIIPLTECVRTRNNRITLQDLAQYQDHNVRFVDQAQAIQLLTDNNDDNRILCYTNQQTQFYNSMVHSIRYPDTTLPFATGERVVVHSPYITPGNLNYDQTLITSEECTVADIQPSTHTLYNQQYSAYDITLERDDDTTMLVYLPQDQQQMQNTISQLFDQWRTLKQQAYNTSKQQQQQLLTQAGTASKHAWTLKEYWIQLRHAYSMTVHKSQGSTYNTVVIDWDDLNRIHDRQLFNQCLYVAASRPANSLMFVV